MTQDGYWSLEDPDHGTSVSTTASPSLRHELIHPDAKIYLRDDRIKKATRWKVGLNVPAIRLRLTTGG